MGLRGKGKLTTDGQTSEQSSRRKTEMTKEFFAKQDLDSTRGRVVRIGCAYMYIAMTSSSEDA